MEYFWRYVSPLGGMTMISDGEALTGLRFGGQVGTLPAERTGRLLPVFSQTHRWLDLYFAGEIPPFTPPLRLHGTDFRLAVWDLLLTIPYGKTVSYGEIAAMVAKKRGVSAMSAQAVGGAVGRNPIALIVPCHRVIGADGGMVGYGGGLDRKIRLLSLERSGTPAAAGS